MKFSPMIAAATLLISAPAMAHTGHESVSGLVAGILHPLTGLDHLLAMLAIGCWAAMQSGAMKKAVPLSFSLFLVAGFALALTGMVMPLIESTIAASLLVAGLLMATAIRLPSTLTLLLTSLFALAHGQAHGLEAGAASILLFGAGFILTSALLQLAGQTAYRQIHNAMPALIRTAGSLVALFGGYLLATA